MAESSLWHRLNPFHARPPSSLRRYSPVESTERTSSVDTTVPCLSDEMNDEQLRAVFTPQPFLDSPPRQRRTPSILRSLAHHPSLSALKSRSKRAKRAKGRIPLPDLSGQDDMPDRPESRALGDSPSPKKLRRKGSLKTAKSIPDGLRLSGDSNYPRMSVDHDPFSRLPPMPSPPTPVPFESEATKIRVKRHNRDPSSGTPGRVIRRKPLPTSTTPDIEIHNVDLTPESVRVSRMRFQLDFTMDQSPRSMGSLSAQSSPSRRRAASTSDVDISPSKARSGTSRHLSSPAPPSPFRELYASAHHPFTTQHPHPVPLTRYSGTLYHTHRPGDSHPSQGDFIPLSESGRTLDMDDGLDLLVRGETLPTGTPGGHTADLRRGVLVDGAKPKKNAIRFFSRDMYNNQLPSASPSPTPSLGTINTHLPDHPPDRSESPYEIKLSPMVTKRMSLDAFGTPSPPSVSQLPSTSSDIEEILEEGDCAQDEEEPGGENSGYLHTTLSTIQEGPSWGQESVPERSREEALSPSQESTVLEQTLYYTPFSSKLDRRGLPLRSDRSETAPGFHRQRFSCPPLSTSETLFAAHDDHTRALETELQRARDVIECLEEELSRVTNAEKGHGSNVMQQEGWENTVKELQERLQQRDEELVEARTQIASQAEVHRQAITELRTTIEENEGYFETLQHAHDQLADRLAELENEHAEVLVERARDAATLHEAQEAAGALERRLHQHDGERDEAEKAIVDLQKSLHIAETELQKRNEDLIAARQESKEYTEQSGREVSQLKASLAEKAERIEELEDLLRSGLEREAEMSRLKQTLKTKSERIVELQTRQTEREKSLDAAKETIAERDASIASLKFRLEEAEGEKRRLAKESTAAIKSITAKDLIIGVLRDKLSTADYEKDEVIARGQMAEDTGRALQEKVTALEEEKERLSAARDVMSLEHDHLRVQLATVTAQASSGAVELEKALEELRVLEAARTDWENERANLVAQVEQMAMDATDSAEVLDQVSSFGTEFQAMRDDLSASQAELQLANETLKTRAITIQLQDNELEYLRQALVDTEDAAESIGDGFLRRAKDAERTAESLREQMADLTAELDRRDEAVSKAVMEAEMQKAEANDVKSRLNAFTSELDRLSLANAELKKEVDDVRRESAAVELQVVEAGRKIAQLEQDKDLLNVALDSKQTELTLLQRQVHHGTPRPRQSTLAASTGRLARPSGGLDVTPVPTKTLSKSMYQSSLRHSRSGSVSSTPTQASFADPNTPRGRPAPTPTPLGASTRHNRTPEKQLAGKKGVTGGSSGVTIVVKPSLSKRSSLPVMRGSSLDLGSGRVSEERTRLGVEEEV